MEVGCNIKLEGVVSVIVIVAVVGMPHGVPLLAGFLEFQWSEARLIVKLKKLYILFHYYGVRR